MPRLKYTIGADPELWVDPGTLSNLPGLEGAFGRDNCNRIAELRPAQDLDPLEVVKNIRRILCNEVQAKDIPEDLVKTWCAGSVAHGDALGGHIHFGKQSLRNDGYFVRFLDYNLAPILIKLEDNYNARMRRKKQYGQPGDHRNQVYGVEYRTPASWLVSEDMATGVLCLAGLIGQSYIDNPTQMDSTPYNEHCQKIKGMAPGDLRSLALDAIERVKAMPNYPDYKDMLDMLFKYVRLNWTWFPGVHFSKAWRLYV